MDNEGGIEPSVGSGEELDTLALEVLEDDEILGWADDEEDDLTVDVAEEDELTDDDRGIELVTCVRPTGDSREVQR